jgi:hypothetical protein
LLFLAGPSTSILLFLAEVVFDFPAPAADDALEFRTKGLDFLARMLDCAELEPVSRAFNFLLTSSSFVA